MNDEIVREGLKWIAEFFGGVPDKDANDGAQRMDRVEFWTMLAEKLSRVVGKEPAWSWRYIQSIYQGTEKPSKKFTAAVNALGAAIDEVPTSVVYTVSVKVFARPGAVKEGSVILGESKPCARPGCPVRIVPNVPWRKYCSDECRILHQKEKAEQNEGAKTVTTGRKP